MFHFLNTSLTEIDDSQTLIWAMQFLPQPLLYWTSKDYELYSSLCSFCFCWCFNCCIYLFAMSELPFLALVILLVSWYTFNRPTDRNKLTISFSVVDVGLKQSRRVWYYRLDAVDTVRFFFSLLMEKKWRFPPFKHVWIVFRAATLAVVDRLNASLSFFPIFSVVYFLPCSIVSPSLALSMSFGSGS